jgi:hypothetical protein
MSSEKIHHNNVKMRCWHWNYWVLILKSFVLEHSQLMENATVKIPFLFYPLIRTLYIIKTSVSSGCTFMGLKISFWNWFKCTNIHTFVVLCNVMQLMCIDTVISKSFVCVCLCEMSVSMETYQGHRIGQYKYRLLHYCRGSTEVADSVRVFTATYPQFFTSL